MRPDHPWRKKGEKHPASKLSDKDRFNIRCDNFIGVPAKQIAASYNVCVKTIYRVCK